MYDMSYRITLPGKAPFRVTCKGAWLILTNGTRQPEHVLLEKRCSSGWRVVLSR